MARSSPQPAAAPDLAAVRASLTPPRHRGVPQVVEPVQVASSQPEARLPWTSPGGSIYLSTAAGAVGAVGARARTVPPGHTAAPTPPAPTPEPGPAAPAPSPARDAASTLSLRTSRSAPALGTASRLASRPPPPPPPPPASAETGAKATGRWFWLELPVP